MAHPPSLRKIAKELLEGAPGWVDALLLPLNTFMGQVQEALSGQLTVKENLAQCWVTFTANSGDTIPPLALPTLKGRAPFGVTVERVRVLEGSLVAMPGVEWEPTTLNGKPAVRLLVIHSFPANTRATFTLLVKAE